MTENPKHLDPEKDRLRKEAEISATEIARGMNPDQKKTRALADFLLEGQREQEAEKPKVVRELSIGDFTPTGQVDPSNREVYQATPITFTPSATGGAPKVEIGE